MISTLRQIIEDKKNLSIFGLLLEFQKLFMNDVLKDDFFVRRSILDVFHRWIAEADMSTIFLPNDSAENNDQMDEAVKDIAEEELSPKRCTSRLFVDATQEKKEEALRSFLLISSDAIGDFDWEVRRRIISIWTLLFASTSIYGHPQSTYGHPQSIYDQHTSPSNSSQVSRLQVVNSFIEFGAAKQVIASVLDSEFAVCKAAMECLSHCTLLLAGHSDEDCDADTLLVNAHEIETKLCQYEKFTLKSFAAFLHRIDLRLVLEDLEPQDVQVKCDPTSFLQDIVAAAKRSEDNLLDCY